jgi:hypothetical protein
MLPIFKKTYLTCSYATDAISAELSPQVFYYNAVSGHFRKIDKLSLKQCGVINTNVNGLNYLVSQMVLFMKTDKITCHLVTSTK